MYIVDLSCSLLYWQSFLITCNDILLEFIHVITTSTIITIIIKYPQTQKVRNQRLAKAKNSNHFLLSTRSVVAETYKIIFFVRPSWKCLGWKCICNQLQTTCISIFKDLLLSVLPYESMQKCLYPMSTF